MSVILLSVSFLTRCNDFQRINITLQHQSPAHLLGSWISLPYQSFVVGRKPRLTELLTWLVLLGQHSPHRELRTGANVDFSADLVYFQVFQDGVLNCAVTFQENTMSSSCVF